MGLYSQYLPKQRLNAVEDGGSRPDYGLLRMISKADGLNPYGRFRGADPKLINRIIERTSRNWASCGIEHSVVERIENSPRLVLDRSSLCGLQLVIRIPVLQISDIGDHDFNRFSFCSGNSSVRNLEFSPDCSVRSGFWATIEFKGNEEGENIKGKIRVPFSFAVAPEVPALDHRGIAHELDHAKTMDRGISHPSERSSFLISPLCDYSLDAPNIYIQGGFGFDELNCYENQVSQALDSGESHEQFGFENKLLEELSFHTSIFLGDLLYQFEQEMAIPHIYRAKDGELVAECRFLTKQLDEEGNLVPCVVQLMVPLGHHEGEIEPVKLLHESLMLMFERSKEAFLRSRENCESNSNAAEILDIAFEDQMAVDPTLVRLVRNIDFAANNLTFDSQELEDDYVEMMGQGSWEVKSYLFVQMNELERDDLVSSYAQRMINLNANPEAFLLACETALSEGANSKKVLKMVKKMRREHPTDWTVRELESRLELHHGNLYHAGLKIEKALQMASKHTLSRKVPYEVLYPLLDTFHDYLMRIGRRDAAEDLEHRMSEAQELIQNARGHHW